MSAAPPSVPTRYIPTLRDVSNNVNFDPKSRIAAFVPPLTSAVPTSQEQVRLSAPSSARSGRTSSSLGRPSMSPGVDARHRSEPARCADLTQDIIEMFLAREKTMTRDANYLANQTEVNEKMRTILVDWLVDVHQKFKLHPETFFLTIDIVDRYLMLIKGQRATLQLVGITSLLLAAKYEEIWPPEVKDCIHISANTYTRDDILKMERAIMSALQFRLTTPTPYPLLARLFELTEADEAVRNTAMFFLEHAVQDYKHLNFSPSQLANASFYLAQLTLRRADPWSYTVQYYSKSTVDSFRDAAKSILEYTHSIVNSKYVAIRRKYTSQKFGEVTRYALPTEVQ